MMKGLILLMLAGLSGCQCCSLTEHYASAVDRISDHEHHYERFYSPGWDLNRIGRPDWCSYPKNHWFCPCVCDRCKPAPCGHIVTRVSTRIACERVRTPDWSNPPAETIEPPGIELDDPDGLDTPPSPTPPALP